ncbi:NAD(P)-binding protein [Gymnopus androsaceus JB14]|uniref:NAD(P)-binding protein n=1 Tax=Gymnopus androsaceus JB14 TaxID=1447944 RepID=A0A6A4H797_9AGAR|nr:NAD(P)-binding protein [Gymnopus androsaceus JB14]
MKVLIFGSSGFIGFPAAQALSRAGHIVYGQTRSEAKAKQLAAEESTWILACHGVSGSYLWAHGGTANMQVVSASIREAVILAAQSLRPSHAPKLTYIYTAGTWVHGENRSEIVTDTTPITNPPKLVAWRPEQEQLTVTNSILNGIVVRPALLYGRSGSLFEAMFKEAKVEKKVTWPGTPGGKFALIHADDLADLYVRLAEGASIAGGKIFDAANDISEDVDAFLKKMSIVAGLDGKYEYRNPANLYEVALGTTSLVRPHLGRALFGWQPRKIGLTDGLEIYYAAYLNSVNLDV